MTQRRQSRRSTTVAKSRLLEEKLKNRSVEANLKLQAKKSKALKELHLQEKDEFAQEVSELSSIVDALYPKNSSESSEGSYKSLEWDDSEVSPPSFLTEESRTSLLSDRTQSVVDDIIEDILSLDKPAECQEEDSPEALDSGPSVRRKTSTDNNFLDRPPVGIVPQPGFPWPPRIPSQEPEHFNPHDPSSITQVPDPLEEEVFEPDPKLVSTMEDKSYQDQLKNIKKAKLKVQDSKKTFLANNLTALDTSTYEHRLGKIRDKLDHFSDLVNDLLVDLDENNGDDKAKIEELESMKENLRQEIVRNESEVKQRVSELISSKPVSKAEQESLELKKKESYDREEEKRIAKVEKKSRVEIAMEAISARATTLTKIIHEIDDAKKLTDLQVKENLEASKKWESRLDEIFNTKVKIDQDAVGLDIEQAMKDNVAELVNKAKEAVENKVTELKDIDKEKALFSLSKYVKDLAPYPETFRGKKGDDVYKFKVKFTEAVTANQVPEKHKIDVLRKHLGGEALQNLGDHYATFEDAMQALVKCFGQAQNIWDAKLDEFVTKCNKPEAWRRVGSKQRLSVLGSACEFLREAEKLSKDHPALEPSIYNIHTVKVLIKVLPPDMTEDMNDKVDDDKTPKEEILMIKTYLEKKHRSDLRLSQYSDELSHAQANYGSVQAFDSKKEFYDRKQDDHDCTRSRQCKPDWGQLGCVQLYEIPTVKERRLVLNRKKVCFVCGKKRKPETHDQDSKNAKFWNCKPQTFTVSAPARCKEHQCKLGAAVCSKHAPNNAKQELLDWFRKNQIKTTVTTIIVNPVNTSASQSLYPPCKSKFSKNERSKLQSGGMSVPFSNQQLQEFFVNDLKSKGIKASRETVNPVPEGDIAFVFCKIKGKQSGIQAFIDSGANCCIMSEGIPQKELNSVKLQDGPISIDVATGIVVHASGEWGSVLPLNDGSHQLLRGLTVPRVTSDMPRMMLDPWFEKVKAMEPDNNSLQGITIPKVLGGYVDMILGISFSRVHPEPIHTFPDGLTIYKSKFLPMNPGELACIGGPMASINTMVQSAGARSSIRHLCNLMSSVSAGFSPRLEFFPSSLSEMERNFLHYVDKSIPNIEELLEIADSSGDDSQVNEVVDYCEDEGSDGDNLLQPEVTDSFVGEVACTDCGEAVIHEYQSFAVQSEMKRFLEQQDAGLDCSFRCMRCRDCKLCLKGAGEERKSMQQEAHQEIIRQSVAIDRDLGRAVAKLPFVQDPVNKLTNNTRLATKRLENVCRKYGNDEVVKQMITHSFKKLFDRGHIVNLEDLPDDVKTKIKMAKTSYTIPYDVAFKEGSISTPARPVFDASSKTPGGESLNNLLAKGSHEMVRLIDMMLDWRMGQNAFTGDIRQFYNNVLLHQDHWQYQKILMKKDLDPDAKVMTAIIKTLIYGVKPVGNQCEEIVKLLADEIWDEFPDVATLLVYKRYVDDFGQSTLSLESTENLIRRTNKVLAQIKMEVKGWVIAGKAPPPEASEDGISVGFAGLTWFPAGDFFKLNIQSLHFSKKKRGKFPSDLVKFEQTAGISIDEYTPQYITRTNCTSVAARIYDIAGLVAPVTLKLKYYLRRLITYEPSWTKPIPDHQREIWVNLFKTVEDIRDIFYLRCSIPVDAISCKARVLLLCDAADIGIILGAYVCYERPGDVWSCNLLFGKGLLAQENWTIPNKELHGLSALSNLKVILENCLGGWIQSFHAFSDSEIALCWSIYEKVKLTTFVRNRVINIRSKLGIELLHHVDGKQNPCDVGTRPDLITAESVKPGSVWLSGCEWMKGSLDKAKKEGVIKTVDDIKLSNEKKKSFKEGIAYDSFDEVDQGIFAVRMVGKIDVQKMSERIMFSDYLYDPLKRSFPALVRITAWVLLAGFKWKRALIRKKIERGELPSSAELDWKKSRFPPPKFSVFTYESSFVPRDSKQVNLCSHFSVSNKSVKTLNDEEPVKLVKLNEVHLSAALDHLFKKATKEVKEFNLKKDIEKIATEKDGILYSSSRLLEEAELKVVGHLADSFNVEQFTGINFRVPLVDQHSPLAVCIGLHLHYNKFPHRGAETQYRMSLQYVKILRGKKMFNQIAADCVFCKKLQKKVLEQIMGPLDGSQISISPVFFYTLVDLWGPLTSYVPGYQKTTRSNSKKPHEIYILVFACCATGTVNCQVIEGKDAAFCMDGMNRFFMETTVPRFIYSDEEGGLVKALTHGKIDLVDLAGTLSRQRGIKFFTVVPQGHSGHGRIEKRIHMLQQSLEQSNIRKSKCTSMGWHTLAKAVERTVNSVPIGFLHHQSGGMNPLLRILTPNSLKLISNSDRAPISLFNIPDSAETIMDNIQQKYETWYQVWNEQYLPLIMERQKWHMKKDNLCPGDIVYFMLKESLMSASWRIGKIEQVKIGDDGYVRQALIAYKDTSGDEPADWTHRTVERPVRKIVKLFHINDTTLMDDIKAVHENATKLLMQEEISFVEEGIEKSSGKKSDPKSVPNKEVDFSEENNEILQDIDDFAKDLKKFKTNHEEIDDIAREVKKFRKNVPRKRKTEVEKLKIDLEGWNMVKKINEMKTPEPKTLQAVKIAVSPFIHNFMPAAVLSTVAQATDDKEVFNNMGMKRVGEAEFEDELFDVIIDENTIDSNIDSVYMI